MSATVSADSYQPRMQQIVQDLCTRILGTRVEVTPGQRNPGQRRVISIISFTGDWRGAISLECTLVQAIHFAQQMLGLEATAGVDDDVRDALGELINIVADNLKSFIPAVVEISTPSVIDGSGYEVWFPDSRTVSRDHFSTEGGDFWITLIECNTRGDHAGSNR